MNPLKRPPVFREDGTIELQLTRGMVAVIDAVDAHLAAFNWSYMLTSSGNHYAVRTRSRREDGPHTILLHREIFGLGPGRDPEVDHSDGDGLNCRRKNLRVGTTTENLRNRRLGRNNTSGHVGVRWDGYGWVATLGNARLGRFASLEEAVGARLKAEREQWGIHPQRAAAHEQHAKRRG